ncbi:MAG: hypothetical protein IJH78_09285 [Clostridia bacterium]|nr:hypothetical protein [Clostridia bacterium]
MKEPLLIVYYSLEGNTRFACEQLEQAVPSVSARLIPDREPPRSGAGKFLKGGYSALKREKVILQPLAADPKAFSRLVLACPVWAGTCPPAMHAFLAEAGLSGQRVWLLGTSMSGHTEKMFRTMKALLPSCEVAGALSLISPLRDPERARAEILAFCEAQGLAGEA